MAFYIVSCWHYLISVACSVSNDCSNGSVCFAGNCFEGKFDHPVNGNKGKRESEKKNSFKNILSIYIHLLACSEYQTTCLITPFRIQNIATTLIVEAFIRSTSLYWCCTFTIFEACKISVFTSYAVKHMTSRIVWTFLLYIINIPFISFPISSAQVMSRRAVFVVCRHIFTFDCKSQ